MIEKSRNILKNLLKNQRYGVVATNTSNRPYINLVAFASSDNLKSILFATLKNTKKYNNMIKNSKVSMLIDNRINSPDDIKKAIVVTAIGSGNEIINSIEHFKRLYLKKHPYLSNFVNLNNCALIKIKVEKYILVDHFEKIEIIEIN